MGSDLLTCSGAERALLVEQDVDARGAERSAQAAHRVLVHGEVRVERTRVVVPENGHHAVARAERGEERGRLLRGPVRRAPVEDVARDDRLRPEAQARESIEVRTLVFFAPEN